ncbi:hypothetical protein GWK47_022908 [Chionoecetes opilio]|uniref:Uncharacterized protein n=1 Tax=Chionoecetes opilio TaxID=41210 RepID=A0A8J4XWL7_CHIOP|nr:hypothetical protein GWK47_022908 [Chionoecetes opilio]
MAPPGGCGSTPLMAMARSPSGTAVIPPDGSVGPGSGRKGPLRHHGGGQSCLGGRLTMPTPRLSWWPSSTHSNMPSNAGGNVETPDPGAGLSLPKPLQETETHTTILGTYRALGRGRRGRPKGAPATRGPGNEAVAGPKRAARGPSEHALPPPLTVKAQARGPQHTALTRHKRVGPGRGGGPVR